jgi:hypothetical protein
MMQHRLPVIGMAAVAALVIDLSPSAQAAASGRSCFWSRDVRNVKSSDFERTVNVRVTRNEVFQLKLFSSCRDISWSSRIELRTRGSGHICEGSGLNVEVVPDRRLGRTSRSASQRRCQVTSVRRLTPEEVAALPPSARP